MNKVFCCTCNTDCLTQAFGDQIIPANGGQGHWLIQLIPLEPDPFGAFVGNCKSAYPARWILLECQFTDEVDIAIIDVLLHR